MAQTTRATSVRSFSLDVESLEQRTLLSVSFLYPYGSVDHSGITQGPDGNTWLIDATADRIRRISSDGQVQQFTFPGTDGKALDIGNDIAPGADGKLWFALKDAAGWHVARVSTGGLLEVVSAADARAVTQVEAGGDGNVWFARADGTIARIDPAGQISDVAASNIAHVYDLELAPDGHMWFTGAGKWATSTNAFAYGELVGSITPDGVVSEYRTDSSFGRLTDIVAADDGFLYFGAGGAIGRISAAGGAIEKFSVGALDAYDLTAGPDGNVWFLDLGKPLNPLARLNDDRSVDHFATPGTSEIVNAMAIGSDDKLWITTGADNRVKKFNPLTGLAARSVRLNVDHKESFSKVLGTFFDSTDAGEASDYSATIDWGNGETTGARIVRNEQGGYDVVGDNRLKWGWHTIKITVVDEREPSRDLTFTARIYVVPPPMAGKGKTIRPQAAQEFRGTVATFAGLEPSMLDRYSATIRWGDGSTTPGQLVLGDNGIAKVTGAHTYLKAGQYDIHVWINESAPPSNSGVSGTLGPVPRVSDVIDGPIRPLSYYPSGSPFNDARSRAIVKAPIVDGDVEDLDLVSGQAFEGVLARFETTDGANAIEHYRAEIDFGDGNVVQGVVRATERNEFVVRVRHVFVDEGGTSVTVRIIDDRRPAGDDTVGLIREELEVHRHLFAGSSNITVTAGVEWTGRVGHFETRPDVARGWESTFEVTIRWGDGVESAGTIQPNPNGGYDVFGTHTYEVTGFHRNLSLYIRVKETRTATDPSYPTGSFVYESSGYGGMSTVRPGSFPGFMLQSASVDFGNVNTEETFAVAQLAVSDPGIDLSTFTLSVLWEDGLTTPAVLQPDGDFYQVVATRSFSSLGYHRGTLTVTGAGMTKTADVRAHTREPYKPRLAEVYGHGIQAVKGIEFTGVVARFRPRDVIDDLDQFTVTIGWGDGTSSAAQLVAGADGWIEVHGTHTYTRASGNYPFSTFVTISRGGEYAYGSGSASVTLDPTRLNAEGRLDMHFRQREEFTSKVASFTSPKSDATPDDFEAWIEWGDGTRTRGDVTLGHRRTFEVAGTHAYSIKGTVTIKITVTGPGGADVVTSRMVLDPDPVIVTPKKPDVDGLKIGGRLATFIDEDGKSTDEDVYRVYHAALIDWGDGTETWGIVGERADGSFDVLGSHTYAEAGEYTVKLVLRRNTRYMPQLPRWRRGRDGSYFLDAAAYDAGTGNRDRKDEYAKTLFTVRVKKPKKVTPPKCRPGQKPKRDNCVVVKKKKADKKKSSPTTQRAVAATADVLSLFSSRRIEADMPSLF